MFLPGFFLGVLLQRLSKKLITLEHMGASTQLLKLGPWSSIFTGLILGSLMHYYVNRMI